MKALIIGELRKIFSQKIVVIVAALLLLINVFNIYYSVVDSSDYWLLKEAEDKIYSIAEGEIAESNVKALVDYKDKMFNANQNNEKIETILGTPLSDYYIAQKVVDKLTAVYNYASSITQLKENVLIQKDVLESKNNPYLKRVNEKIEKVYTNREISSFYNTTGYEKYFSYNFSSFLIILIVILGVSTLFSGEKEVGMLQLNLSTANGRIRLTFAKLVACITYSILVGLLFYLSDYIVFSNITTMNGLNLPIYSLDSFEFSPASFSIGSFIFITTMIKIGGIVYISVITALLSSILNRSYVVLAFSLIVVFAFMYGTAYSTETMIYISLINPINLLTCTKLFETFNVVNIFNYPMFSSSITLIMSCLCVSLILLSIFIINNKNSKRVIK